MAPIAPYPCPICGAPPARREQLRDDFELCPRCGFAIRLDEGGALVAWATTNVSHPRGVRAAVVLLAAALGIIGCTTALTTASPAGQPPPHAIVLGEELSGDVPVCVPRWLPTSTLRYACIRLGDLRVLLRSTRLADSASSEDRP